MYFLVLIICLFIFLFSVYVLGKDDYVLIRRNFSLENLFDYVFIGLFAGIIFARFLWFLIRSKVEKGFLLHLFSPGDVGISLAGLVFGCMLFLFLISKYRKLATARLFDFFSLAFLPTFSFGYLASSLFVKFKIIEMAYYVVPGIIYLGLGVFFWKVLYPKVIGSKLKSGSLSSLFFQAFSFLSFFFLLVYQFLNKSLRVDAAYIFLVIIFLGSLIFFLRNERRFKKAKYNLK